MDVMLHIGAHRTATTTFQRMLGASRDALIAAGIAYWGPKRLRSGLLAGFGADPLTQLLPWERRRLTRRVGRIRLAMTDHRQAGATRLIVSEENMLGPLRPNLTQGSLYPYARHRLTQFAEAFGPETVRIGIGIRCYDHYWASSIGSLLARGGPAPSAALAAGLVAQPRRWRNVIAEAARAFPGAEILVWSHEALANRPNRQMAALLDAPPPPLKGIDAWHNAGPGLPRLRDEMSDRGDDPALIADAGGQFMPFTHTDRATLRAHYAEDLAWLRDGADGLARFIDDPATDRGATGQGRGRSHDGENRRLA